MTTQENRKVALAELPTPSTAITTEVEMVAVKGSALLKFDFDRDEELFHGGVQFMNIRASRWRTEAHCTAWHIEGAYDTVVEVENSEWVRELVSAQARPDPVHRTLRHFMIFIDSAGCFEFVAAAFEILPVEPVL